MGINICASFALRLNFSANFSGLVAGLCKDASHALEPCTHINLYSTFLSTQEVPLVLLSAQCANHKVTPYIFTLIDSHRYNTWRKQY